jgi:hypothetical protein
MDLLLFYLFWEEQNIRVNYFFQKEVFFQIIYLISVNFVFYCNMVPDRCECIVVSLVQLHGHLFCLMTGLQYFIETQFEIQMIIGTVLLSFTKGNSSLVRVIAP